MPRNRRTTLGPNVHTSRQYRRRVETRRFATLDDGVLAVDHQHGFFSVCTVTLCELARADGPVRSIDTSRTLGLYRETPDGCRWERFFAPPRLPVPDGDPAADLGGLPWSVNDRVRRRDLTTARPFVAAWFRPSDAVRTRAAELAERHDVEPSRTVGVWVRATDKARELRLPDIDRYARAVRRALARRDVDRVLVQSDQAQVRDALMDRFGVAAVCFDELPVTTTAEGLHFQALPGRETHVFDLLASVVLLSTCRNLVLHRGNGAYWTVRFREGLQGVAQPSP